MVAVERRVRNFPASAAVTAYVAVVAPVISVHVAGNVVVTTFVAVQRAHCNETVGTGMPVYTPAVATMGDPTRGVPGING